MRNSYVDNDRRNDILNYEADLGRNLDIAHDFYPIHQQWNVSRLNWYIDGGRIPMVTWRVGTNADDFLAGDYDEQIRVRAQQAKQVDGLFFNRFFHEMDSYVRIDWGLDGADGAAKFVQMWRHTYNIFAQEGVTNAVWVWSPATFRWGVSPVPYYPGDNFVDWIAVDPYLWSPCNTAQYTSVTDEMGTAFWDFAAAHPTKPIMLAEWGAGDQPGTDHRERFLDSVGDMVKANPNVAALVYFDAYENLPCDWRLEDDADGWAAYRNLAHDPYVVVDSGTAFG